VQVQITLFSHLLLQLLVALVDSLMVVLAQLVAQVAVVVVILLHLLALAVRVLVDKEITVALDGSFQALVAVEVAVALVPLGLAVLMITTAVLVALEAHHQ